MATIIIKRLICIATIWAIFPAISFANQQGLAALKRYEAGGDGVAHCADTIPPPASKEEPLPEPKKTTVVKKVPKSRRQVKPTPLPGTPVKPIIKPKVVKPAITVSVI